MDKITEKPTQQVDENGLQFSPVYSIVCTYVDGNIMQQVIKTLHIEKYVRKMIDADSETDNRLLSAVALRVNSMVIDSVAAVRDYKDTSTWYFTTKRYIKSTPLKQNNFPLNIKGRA